MPAMSSPALVARLVIGVVAALSFLAGAVPAAAHGPVPPEPPTPANLLFGWTFPPLPTLAILVALLWWAWAVGRVNGAHPQSRVPRRRTIAFAAAMTALAFALLSGIERYDTTLFSVHMVEHLLLHLVAAPLIVLAAPITRSSGWPPRTAGGGSCCRSSRGQAASPSSRSLRGSRSRS